MISISVKQIFCKKFERSRPSRFRDNPFQILSNRWRFWSQVIDFSGVRDDQSAYSDIFWDADFKNHIKFEVKSCFQGEPDSFLFLAVLQVYRSKDGSTVHSQNTYYVLRNMIHTSASYFSFNLEAYRTYVSYQGALRLFCVPYHLITSVWFKGLGSRSGTSSKS